MAAAAATAAAVVAARGARTARGALKSDETAFSEDGRPVARNCGRNKRSPPLLAASETDKPQERRLTLARRPAPIDADAAVADSVSCVVLLALSRPPNRPFARSTTSWCGRTRAPSWSMGDRSVLRVDGRADWTIGGAVGAVCGLLAHCSLSDVFVLLLPGGSGGWRRKRAQRPGIIHSLVANPIRGERAVVEPAAAALISERRVLLGHVKRRSRLSIDRRLCHLVMRRLLIAGANGRRARRSRPRDWCWRH
uniref:Uncharacterized protein n=1 Tax=Plectus sambesii TaxID=2011161 RepID=A0A914VWE3_9BILA